MTTRSAKASNDDDGDVGDDDDDDFKQRQVGQLWPKSFCGSELRAHQKDCAEVLLVWPGRK